MKPRPLGRETVLQQSRSREIYVKKFMWCDHSALIFSHTRYILGRTECDFEYKVPPKATDSKRVKKNLAEMLEVQKLDFFLSISCSADGHKTSNDRLAVLI